MQKLWSGLALLAALLSPAASRATEGGAPPDPLKGFDAQVAKAVADWRVPGLAIAVVKDGKVVFSRGYGVRDIETRTSIDTRTLFAIGSTTKAMTAAALGMLVDEGRLKWDDPVVRHLPWFALKDPAQTRELTIRDLLTHRAGLPNTDYLWYRQELSPRETLERLRLVDAVYAPRSSFIYQNLMYATAGAVVEAVSGMPWTRFIETRIFEPLGMTGSLSTARDLPGRANRAEPHFIVDGAVRRIENASVDSVAPAGAIWSNVDDMARWVSFVLNDGVVGEKRLLSKATVTELFTPQAIVTREAFYPTAELTKPGWRTYGLGWFQQDYAGEKVDFHTGSIDGMVAICGLIRSRGIGVYVLANLDHAELRHALMFTAFDRLLGRPSRDWSAEFLSLYGRLLNAAADEEGKVIKARVQGTRPSRPLSAYAGVYRDPLHGDVVVSETADGLRVAYGKPFEGLAEHWNFDTFRVRWNAAWRGTALVSFVLNETGDVEELRMMDTAFRRAAAH